MSLGWSTNLYGEEGKKEEEKHAPVEVFSEYDGHDDEWQSQQNGHLTRCSTDQEKTNHNTAEEGHKERVWIAPEDSIQE